MFNYFIYTVNSSVACFVSSPARDGDARRTRTERSSVGQRIQACDDGRPQKRTLRDENVDDDDDDRTSSSGNCLFMMVSTPKGNIQIIMIIIVILFYWIILGRAAVGRRGGMRGSRASATVTTVPKKRFFINLSFFFGAGLQRYKKNPSASLEIGII